MARKTRFRQAFPALSILATLAAFAANPAGAAEVACRENQDYVVEIDGEFPPDARFYETDTNGKFLVDIPSRSKSVLIDLQSGRAVLLPRASLRPEPIDGTIRVREPGGLDTSAASVAVEGGTLAFKIDTSQVRVLKNAGRPPGAAANGTKTPAVEGAPATACLGIEARPTTGIPGCSKWVHVRNRCPSAVSARIQRVEHLFSGNLPQAFSVVVPPASEQSLGCAWWSGSMAPTDYELLAGVFIDSPAGPGTRGRRGSTPH